MFERFTDKARRVIVYAQEEARSFDHDYIGTEHLLLGLLREADGLAARALGTCGVTLDAARAEVDRMIGRGPTPPKGHIPFTPRAKKVMELSLRQALRIGHDYIGTEHILLGLVHEGEGVAAQILMTNVDGGLENVQDEIVKMLDIPRQAMEQLRHVRGSGITVDIAGGDEVRKRLEAIEARLSAIEQLLRQQRHEGEEEVS